MRQTLYTIKTVYINNAVIETWLYIFWIIVLQSSNTLDIIFLKMQRKKNMKKKIQIPAGAQS